MNIITNVLRFATAGALAAALMVPAWADDEEFPDGPAAEGEEALFDLSVRDAALGEEGLRGRLGHVVDAAVHGVAQVGDVPERAGEVGDLCGVGDLAQGVLAFG